MIRHVTSCHTTIHLSLVMPPKGRKSKAKPKTVAKPKATTADIEVPQSVTEVASETVSNVVNTVKNAVDSEMAAVKEGVNQVAAAASDFVATASGMQAVEDDSQPVAGPSRVAEVAKDISNAATEFVEKMDGIQESASRMTPEERQTKMDELRKRMVLFLTGGYWGITKLVSQRDSAQANRAAVVREATTQKVTYRDQVRLEKQRQMAEQLRSQARAEEEGREDDQERAKNWTYTIEENDAWEKRLKRKKGRADFEFHSTCLLPWSWTRLMNYVPIDDDDQARKKYKRDLDQLRPDLVAYNKQKEVALGLKPGTLVKTNDTGHQLVVPTQQQQLAAAESLYRDGNTLLYADNIPTEEVLDKMVAKLNKECVLDDLRRMLSVKLIGNIQQSG